MAEDVFDALQRAVPFQVFRAATHYPAAGAQLAGDQRAVLQAGDADRQVVAFLLEVDDPVVQLQDHFQARVARHEFHHQRPQPERAEAHRRHHPQFPAQVVLAQGHAFRGVVQVLQRGLGRLVEEAAGLGRLDVARGAVEQAHAEVALQVADAFADHGLGQAHAFGGGADAAQLDHVEEGLYVFKAQAHGESRNNREADCRMRENSW